MRRSKLSAEVLAGYLPEGCVEPVVDWFNRRPVVLRITRSRSSKLGDFRSGTATISPVITINNDLNPYRFLITLLHEMAHAEVYFSYKRRMAPHGWEWKEEYRRLAIPFLEPGLLPEMIRITFYKYLINPKASSSADVHLLYALKEYDKPGEGVPVFKLNSGTLFALPNGSVFRKGEKRRKLYKCECIDNRKTYLFNPMAEVFPLQPESEQKPGAAKAANMN